MEESSVRRLEGSLLEEFEVLLRRPVDPLLEDMKVLS